MLIQRVNKLKWDRKLGVLKLSHVLTAGAVFPFDFGFVPGTHGADGDALDVLVLSDEPLFPLCLVQARLIGVIEAEQTQEGKTIRNDRMVAVAVGSRLYAKVSDFDDLPPIAASCRLASETKTERSFNCRSISSSWRG